MSSDLTIESARLKTDEELTLLLQSGGKTAIKVLLERYTPFVRFLASRYYGASLENDDIIQEGLIALLFAAYSYSSQKNASFKTYSAVCIANRIRTVTKAQAANKNSMLNTYVPLEDVDAVSYSTPESRYIDSEHTKELVMCMNDLLSPLEKRVVSLCLEGYTNKETADRLDISPKAVANALQRIRGKLKKAANKI